jgi:transcriptional regulator with GAF, ATPase, and Fis domain
MRRRGGTRGDTVPGAARRILGRSEAIRRLLQRIERVGPTEATVLIQGERGTGKELVAAAVHEASRRRDRPYVTLNCAALPVDLLASELFGHERGAFTGALERRPGLLAAADTGTAFLDEIGDLSPQGQAALLRFLQEREVRPLGATRSVHLDVRVIAATNRDLATAVEKGEFRADLYDRISEVVLTVAPLRDRREDILILAETFVTDSARRHGVVVKGLSRDAGRALAAHDWPGNVRELEKALSRAVIFANARLIQPSDMELMNVRAVSNATLSLLSSNIPQSSPLSPRQTLIAAMAAGCGAVRRGDVTRRLGISGETARRELSFLVRRGVLGHAGRHRGSWYSVAGSERLEHEKGVEEVGSIQSISESASSLYGDDFQARACGFV